MFKITITTLRVFRFKKILVQVLFRFDPFGTNQNLAFDFCLLLAILKERMPYYKLTTLHVSNSSKTILFAFCKVMATRKLEQENVVIHTYGSYCFNFFSQSTADLQPLRLE